MSLPTRPPQRMGKEKRLAPQQEVISLRKEAAEPARDRQAGFYYNIFGRSPDIDLFASRKSAQLPVYFSPDKKDRRAAGINALVQPWNFSRMYAFLPHQLILLVLARMKKIKGVLMLVTLFWTRSVWLTELQCSDVFASFQLIDLHPHLLKVHQPFFVCFHSTCMSLCKICELWLLACPDHVFHSAR